MRVDAEHAGQRLDNFLAAHFREVPRGRLYRSVRTGEVRVNRGRARQDYRLEEGDLVRLPPLSVAPAAPTATPSPALRARLEEAVLLEDAYLLIVDKPAGLAVHGGSGQSLGLIEALRLMRPQQRFLELAHRLDRETSGCLVLAKRRSALVAVHAALREGEVDKRYRTLLAGRWRGGGRRVDVALRRGSGRAGERTVRPDRSGQAASTAFTPIACGDVASYMEARPHTGRTHQIRVHAASLGMPVAGDDRYGDRELNRRLRGHGLRRLFLHARSLRFAHPASGETLRVEAPLPRDLAAVLESLGLRGEAAPAALP